MRVPISWLLEYVELPAGQDVPTPEELSDHFVSVGLEVEELHRLEAVTGPLVIGKVLEIEELTEFKKPIRYCKVEVGDAQPAGIVCGASNFVVGDHVVVARPGAVLPGDFTISARKTYGRTSEGMICSASELGLGDDHTGILVIPGEPTPGEDATPILGLDDTVIEFAVTPDRGYCFSVRGIARELACALDVPFADPASIELPKADGDAHPVHIQDPTGCSRFVARKVTGLDPSAPSPWWMRRRLALCGMRPISLAVDVTNYVMIELGQPLHAFDATKVDGDIVVRRATDGEKLTTLDDANRVLDTDDIVVCDGSGPVALAGVMGGASTEVGDATTEILLEAATWDPPSIARVARRHKLPSEASRRFERAVDPQLPPVAAERAASLLAEFGGAAIAPGRTDVGVPAAPRSITMPLDLPDKVAGVRYERGATVYRLNQVGCKVEVTADDGVGGVTVVPPSWRPDLTQPADLVEEVLRLQGYDSIPPELPPAEPGRGLTPAQRRRRNVSRALAHAGYTEVLPNPFVSATVWDDFGLPADDPRRVTAGLLNPLESDRDRLSTTLLPGLIEALNRNVSRGQRDLALYAVEQVIVPTGQEGALPDPGVSDRPSDAELGQLFAGLPAQPLHVAAILTGQWERQGWWGEGRAAVWADAVEAARVVARGAGVEFEVRKASTAPWHPGRCAELLVDGRSVGFAGELHPAVLDRLELPARSAAVEIDLDAIPLVDNRPAPTVIAFPAVHQDIALVVEAAVPVAEIEASLRSGGGDLLEDVRLFDVYTGAQVGEGKRSLAFALRLRAPDRTLTAAEATTARDAAVATAAERHGAVLRS